MRIFFAVRNLALDIVVATFLSYELAEEFIKAQEGKWINAEFIIQKVYAIEAKSQGGTNE